MTFSRILITWMSYHGSTRYQIHHSSLIIMFLFIKLNKIIFLGKLKFSSVCRHESHTKYELSKPASREAAPDRVIHCQRIMRIIWWGSHDLKASPHNMGGVFYVDVNILNNNDKEGIISITDFQGLHTFTVYRVYCSLQQCVQLKAHRHHHE